MHSLNHQAYGHAVADERVKAAERRGRSARPERPPPVRGRAAYAVARVARLLDRGEARRAVA
jgi:hypothetical protein